MVDFCIVAIVDDETIITDFYIKHKASSIKRRILGKTGQYDSVGMHSLDFIVRNSNRVYMYSSFKESRGYKLGIQSLIDMDIDLDKVITMEKNTRLDYTGDNNTGLKQQFLKVLFDGIVDFSSYEEKIDGLQVLKYCAASFSKLYGPINAEIHRSIKNKAEENFRTLENELIKKYDYKHDVRKFTKHLRELKTEEATKDRNKYIRSRRASNGLSVASVLNKNETLYHGHTTSNIYKEYMELIDRDYERIHIDCFGYPLTIQHGHKFEVDGLKLTEKVKQYNDAINKFNNTDNAYKLHEFLLKLIKGLYENNVYISECNIQYIEFAIPKKENMKTKLKLIDNILEETGYKDLFNIINVGELKKID